MVLGDVNGRDISWVRWWRRWRESIPPTVSFTTPASGASNVALNSAITTSFSEAMTASTINTTTFTLKQGTTSVAGSVNYVGTTATFTPAANLAASLPYTATISTGVRDVAGNPIAAAYSWTFTTGTTTDTTAPTVSATIPMDTSSGVSLNSNIAATFSEAVNAATITSTSFTLMQGASAVPGTVTYVGTTATFDPTSNLVASTTYTATVTMAVKDFANNALSTNKVWTFTTGTTTDTTAPTVSSTTPLNAASSVGINSNILANFSEAMDASTLSTSTFSLMKGSVAVSGVVDYVGTTATFNPNIDLAASSVYTATVTTSAKDLAGNALASNQVWSFTTGAASANPTAPNFGEAGRFVIFASAAISGDAATAISNGDIGITPAARTFITGLTPSANTSNPGGFTELTNGLSYAPEDSNTIAPSGYTIPYPYPLKTATVTIGSPWATTGAMLTQASTDLGVADTFLAADPNPSAPTQVLATDLGNMVMTRGVYKSASNVTITTGSLTLDAQGDPNSVFIFNIGGTLTTGAPGGSIILTGGALAKNVYWRTAGITTIAANTAFKGTVVATTQVNVLSGAAITGSLFAVTDRVTLISNAVTKAP